MNVLKILVAVGILFSSAFTFSATKPNLILITLDSARADRMGFLGAKPSSPILDRLAGEASCLNMLMLRRRGQLFLTPAFFWSHPQHWHD
jgi:hypothetical protein